MLHFAAQHTSQKLHLPGIYMNSNTGVINLYVHLVNRKDVENQNDLYVSCKEKQITLGQKMRKFLYMCSC